MQVWILHQQSEPSKGKLPFSGNAPGQTANCCEEPSPQPHPKANILHDEFQDSKFRQPRDEKLEFALQIPVQVWEVLSRRWWGWLTWLLSLLPGTVGGFYCDFSAALAVLRVENVTAVFHNSQRHG